MPRPFRKILSPVAFDDNSLAAVDYAARLARDTDGTVYLLHVVPTDDFLNEAYAEEAAEERLAAIARERLPNGVRSEILTRVGDPAEMVLEVERKLDADLVVMSTHGRDGLPRFFLGSVAEKVVRESPRPVLTVRREDDAGR